MIIINEIAVSMTALLFLKNVVFSAVQEGGGVGVGLNQIKIPIKIAKLMIIINEIAVSMTALLFLKNVVFSAVKPHLYCFGIGMARSNITINMP